MREYQAGHSEAFDILFRRHSSRVYGFLLSNLRDRSRADDVFQETFLKLHRSRNHYDPSFPFMPWLFTVAKSVMVDAIRKSAATKEDPSPDIERAGEITMPTKGSDRVDLEGLNPREREAIELRYQSDLPFEEIAKRLKTSPANVRQLISRGIKRLKALTASKGE